jgi:predicted aldo/keto reductase-like oxidoreductase
MRKNKLNRRKFIRNSSFGMLSAGIFGSRDINPVMQDPENDPPKIKGYKILGRTGFRVSDLGAGWDGGTGAPTLKAVLNAGINLIETSEVYSRGNHEKSIGTVIKDFRREELFIISKIRRIEKYPTAAEVISRAEASLERLQTDYMDCYMIHGALSSATVNNEAFHEAMDKMQKAGKIRFRGVSCHGHSLWDNPKETHEEVLLTAIEDGRFDVILLPYNFMEKEMSGRVIKAAKKRNIGTLAMKSNPIRFYEYLDNLKKEKEEKGDTLGENRTILWEKYKQQTQESEQFFKKYGYESIEELKDGVIQFVLSNPDLHSICFRFNNFASVEKFIRLSGTTLDDGKQAMLDDFREICGPLQCRIGCNLCESSCPYRIPVGTIMRYSYYFHATGREKYAMQQYKELPGRKPDACIDCEGFCENACPYGVLTRPLLTMAHYNLSFDNPLHT